jgi:hypothetical protein
MVMLDSARRGAPVPSLARWLLGLDIAATLAANVAYGLGTVRSVPWWARGRRWRWWVRTNFLSAPFRCCATWRWSALRGAFATHLASVVLVLLAAQRPARADLQQIQHPARRRREVDQGSTSANRGNVLIAVIATPGEGALDDDRSRDPSSPRATCPPRRRKHREGCRTRSRPKPPRSSPTTLRAAACRPFDPYARDFMWGSLAPSWYARISPRSLQARPGAGDVQASTADSGKVKARAVIPGLQGNPGRAETRRC